MRRRSASDRGSVSRAWRVSRGGSDDRMPWIQSRTLRSCHQRTVRGAGGELYAPRSVDFAVEVLLRGNLAEDKQGAVLAIADLSGQTDGGQGSDELLELGKGGVLVWGQGSAIDGQRRGVPGTGGGETVADDIVDIHVGLERWALGPRRGHVCVQVVCWGGVSEADNGREGREYGGRSARSWPGKAGCLRAPWLTRDPLFVVRGNRRSASCRREGHRA